MTARWLIPYDRAIDYFTNEIRANPADTSAYLNRALIWLDKNEVNIALADYREVIRLEPGGESGWVGRGMAYAAKKDYDRAIADYGEAIRLDPNFALAYDKRGYAWRSKKEYDQAIADFTEAIRLDPKDEFAYIGRGLAWGEGRNTTRRSPTIPWPFASTRITHGRTSIAAMPWPPRRTTTGRARLRRGQSHRPQRRYPLPLSWHRLV